MRSASSWPYLGQLRGRGLGTLSASRLLARGVRHAWLTVSSKLAYPLPWDLGMLLRWLTAPMQQSFCLVALALPKFLRKRLGRRVSIEARHVPAPRRAGLVVRELFMGLDSLPNVSLLGRLSRALCDLGTNRAKSTPCVRKARVYLAAARQLRART